MSCVRGHGSPQDALQAVLDLASAPRLADGDYADVVRLVKRVLTVRTT